MSALVAAAMPGRAHGGGDAAVNVLTDLAKLGGRVGIMSVAALVPSSRETMLLVAEMERAKAVGRAVGLTDEESSEVIATWMAWYRTTPYDPEWHRILRALEIRWAGQEDWRP
jgi:hypothetical protein